MRNSAWALSGESISSAATTAEVLIRDNDDGVITVTAVTGTVSEGEAANFRLELTEGSTETGIGVEWSVSCEGDVSAEDFVGGCPSGTATIAAGQISTISRLRRIVIVWWRMMKSLRYLLRV